VPRVHHQLAINCLHRQITGFELGPDIDRDAKYLHTNRTFNMMNGDGGSKRQQPIGVYYRHQKCGVWNNTSGFWPEVALSHLKETPTPGPVWTLV